MIFLDGRGLFPTGGSFLWFSGVFGISGNVSLHIQEGKQAESWGDAHEGINVIVHTQCQLVKLFQKVRQGNGESSRRK